MALDLETLLAPVSEEAPTGEYLPYDPDRATIEQAFERSVSIDTPGADAAASATPVEMDWRPIIALIEGLSARTKDFWLPVYLCRAGARSGDLETVQVGAAFLAGLFERYWANAHPQLEEEGFQGRKGPCESLTTIPDFLGPLRSVPLLVHPRLGRFTGADFERFKAGAENEDGYGMFRKMLEETPDETLQDVAVKLDAITASIKAVDMGLTSHAEGDTATNFKPTYDTLAAIRAAVLSFSKTPPADAAEDGGAAVEAGAGDSGRLSGRVDSREDVIKALDAVADYYRRREPSSPVPLVLQRAREWVTLDFLSVLQDIAPNSLEDARNVLSLRKKEDGS